MTTAVEAITLFQQPITQYKAIGVVQKFLLRKAVTNGNQALAAMRLLAIFGDTDLEPLFLKSLDVVTLGTLSDDQWADLTTLQDLLASFKAFETTVNVALAEAKAFLPDITIDVLNEYNHGGAPIERLGVSIFLVMTANLQE